MDRERLLQEMSHAFSPNETSSAITDAREYLTEHPDDKRVWAELEVLMEAERGYVVG